VARPGGVYTVVACRNVFDQFYYEPQSFIPESGRTFAISVRREFRPGWFSGGSIP